MLLDPIVVWPDNFRHLQDTWGWKTKRFVSTLTPERVFDMALVLYDFCLGGVAAGSVFPFPRAASVSHPSRPSTMFCWVNFFSLTAARSASSTEELRAHAPFAASSKQTLSKVPAARKHRATTRRSRSSLTLSQLFTAVSQSVSFCLLRVGLHICRSLLLSIIEVK